MVLTFNEAPNIGRVLDKLDWAGRILVVESGSTDGTADIVRRYPRAELITRPFDGAAAQCNFGLEHVRTDWVLSLDADYVLGDDLIRELHEREDSAIVAGYRASFVYQIHGQSLRGSLYPPRTVLYRTKASRYVDEGHTQRIVVSGEIGALRGVIFHDDRKPLSRWLTSQQRYARLEAEHLLTTPPARLSRTARFRKMALPAPFLVLAYVLIVKRCILEGRFGWFYALQRLLAETIVALELIEQRRAGLPAATRKFPASPHADPRY